MAEPTGRIELTPLDPRTHRLNLANVPSEEQSKQDRDSLLVTHAPRSVTNVTFCLHQPSSPA